MRVSSRRAPAPPRRPAPGFLLLAALLLAAGLPAAGLPAPSRAQEAYTLDDLLRMGRERNPTVLALRASRAALEAGLRDASRWGNPELEYGRGEGSPFGSTETRRLERVGLRQAIENPLTRHRRLQAARKEVEAAGEEIRSGILEVDHQIRLHYYGVLYLQELLRLARLNEEALDAIRELIEARAELGEVRPLEAVRLRVEHLRARNEVEAAELELDQFRRHLNTFLGNVLSAGYTLAGELSADPGEPDLDRLLEEVLPHHPAIQEAARRREAAQQELLATRTGWLPDPVISGGSSRELDGNVRTLGLSLRIPLWNQSRGAAERNRQRVRALELHEEALRQEMAAQVMIHHTQLRLDRRTLQLFEEGLLAQAEASMEIAEASYREGEISFVEYLDARRTYHSIQIERQRALFGWNQQRAALDRAAGGGIP